MNADEVNARRVAAIRRHRGKPEVIRQLKARVRELVLGGDSAKSVALAVNLSSTNACKWIRAIGFRLMYVTSEERAWLMARRSAARASETKAA